MSDFKFKIGDEVILKSSATLCRWHAMRGESHIPRPIPISGRMREECPGGVQFHYALGSERVNESDLILASEYDPCADIQVMLEASDQITAARNEISRKNGNANAVEVAKSLKEFFVDQQDFDAASIVRDLIDKLRKVKTHDRPA